MDEAHNLVGRMNTGKSTIAAFIDYAFTRRERRLELVLILGEARTGKSTFVRTTLAHKYGTPMYFPTTKAPYANEEVMVLDGMTLDGLIALDVTTIPSEVKLLVVVVAVSSEILKTKDDVKLDAIGTIREVYYCPPTFLHQKFDSYQAFQEACQAGIV